MHSGILFVSKAHCDPVSEDELTEQEMHRRDADYWGFMYKPEEVKKITIEGDVPMFLPVGDGKYIVNQKYVDQYFEEQYKRMMDAIFEIQKKGLKEFSSFNGMGTDVYRLKTAYSDSHGFLVKGDPRDFGLDTLADFFRWDRCQLENDGKAPEYYIRGIMDYHF